MRESFSRQPPLPVNPFLALLLESHLDGLGDSQRESGRFARFDSQKKKRSHSVRAIRENRLKPAIRNFECTKTRFARKKGVQFGNMFNLAGYFYFAWLFLETP